MTKHLLVTGAAKGIGAAIATAAGQAGYRVAVADIDMTAAQAHAATIDGAQAYAVDVTDPTMVAAAMDQFGDIDVVVNNAGILRTGPLLTHSPDAFRQVLDVNLTAFFIVGQAAAQRMMGAGGGVIINMSSINAIHPSPECGAYVAAKAGVAALTQQMSIEWGRHHIRVNAVAPGFVDAGMSTPFYADDAVRERRASAVPLGRLGSAEDIAQTVLFLASEQASYITGQTVTVDGGVINSVLAQLPRE